MLSKRFFLMTDERRQSKHQLKQQKLNDIFFMIQRYMNASHLWLLNSIISQGFLKKKTIQNELDHVIT